MRVLLDTHVFIWATTDDARLSKEARAILTDANAELLLSSASAWEIAIKCQTGRLRLPSDPLAFVPAHMSVLRMTALPVQVSHALAVTRLPPLHRDPFDRMLIAQAQAEAVPIITADPQIVRYPVDIIW